METPVDILQVGALPVVGVIVAALIAPIGTNSRWALDFFHVAGGGIWTALDLFLGFVLGPILGRRYIGGIVRSFTIATRAGDGLLRRSRFLRRRRRARRSSR